MNSELNSLIERGESLNSKDTQSIIDWVFEVESFLKESNLQTEETDRWVKNVKNHVFTFKDGNCLISYLKQQNNSISLPSITKRNQVFVAMWFNREIDEIYECYERVIQSNNYTCCRIDKIEYDGSIMMQITEEINNSAILIADLTGNRGGVYYEAGIAKGLSLCKHPIRLILTCKKECFDNPDTKPHFDVAGDNIIVYENIEDLKIKLDKRIRLGVMSSD